MCKIIVLWLALLPPALFAQQVDTLWSVPQLDGGIDYRPVSGIYTMSISSTNAFPGDGFDLILGEEVFTRDYLCFDLSILPNLDTLSINQAIIGIYQVEAVGNGQIGIYPIWNVAGGDTHFCVLDHINYGNSLDLVDWTAGDPGDPQTLHTNIGIISDDPSPGYKTMDVTNYVLDDIANQRQYNQYRMRFTIDLDYDSLGDNLLFKSGNSITPLKPYLAIQYNDTTGLEHYSNIIPAFQLDNNYPNPFNATTLIVYRLTRAGFVELNVFDNAGRLVDNLVKIYNPNGEYKITFNASDLPSGIYYYRLKFQKQSITKKLLIIR